MMNKIRSVFLITAAILVLCFPANAAFRDFYSRDWWVTKSGIETGTINDIKFTYLGNLGYTGTLNDRLRNWMLDATGAGSGTMNDLIYGCFEATTACADYGADGNNFVFVDTNDFMFIDDNNFMFVE